MTILPFYPHGTTLGRLCPSPPKNPHFCSPAPSRLLHSTIVKKSYTNYKLILLINSYQNLSICVTTCGNVHDPAFFSPTTSPFPLHTPIYFMTFLPFCLETPFQLLPSSVSLSFFLLLSFSLILFSFQSVSFLFYTCYVLEMSVSEWINYLSLLPFQFQLLL